MTADNAKTLNLRQKQFCEVLASDPERNQTRAYELVYTARGDSAGVAASKLMQNPAVLDYLDELTEGNRERNRLTADLVLGQLLEIIMADPRELNEYRRGACRYCYGVGFKYQRTPGEYQRELEAYVLLSKGKDDLGLGFNVQGGVGFNPNKPPHHDCPECHGHGVGYTYAKDSRKLAPAAARLFAGVKETREGFQLLTRSQDKAMELAMRHLGLMKDKDPSETEVPPAATVTYTQQDARQEPEGEP